MVFLPSRHTNVLVYCVLRVLTKFFPCDLTAFVRRSKPTIRRPWRSYCDHGVPVAATKRRHTLQSMIIVSGFERRTHGVHGDLTATEPRPYYDCCVSTASLRRP
ncbi:hypothetical protein DPMN_146409 [Dreissena polymorpha]|uniref:Uncharacterized protein n=1 Tax=Dreissena polymorpha TaxID=45954 RepID=A0A9D4F6J2_DREPO|nr:hypothetical protein DPMN_146409 [Dreissena polymorpha]